MFLASASRGGSSSAAPGSVVKSFYAWYFSAPSPWDHLKDARPFLTSSLYSLLGQVISYERRTNDEILDADPFIDAQIASSGVTVGNAITAGAKAVVVVQVRYAKTSLRSRVKVILVKTAEGWRIDDFIGDRGGSVRAHLKKEMK
jgi:hypothetical protein